MDKKNFHVGQEVFLIMEDWPKYLKDYPEHIIRPGTVVSMTQKNLCVRSGLEKLRFDMDHAFICTDYVQNRYMVFPSKKMAMESLYVHMYLPKVKAWLEMESVQDADYGTVMALADLCLPYMDKAKKAALLGLHDMVRGMDDIQAAGLMDKLEGNSCRNGNPIKDMSQFCYSINDGENIGVVVARTAEEAKNAVLKMYAKKTDVRKVSISKAEASEYPNVFECF